MLSIRKKGGRSGTWARCWSSRHWAKKPPVNFGHWKVWPLHSHSLEDEIWYVLEGKITFTIGDRTLEAGPGTFAYIPRNTPHTFQVRSDTARWFGFGTPAGLDRWFFETGVPAASLTLPPPSDTPIDIEKIVRSLKEYGTDTLGPPPA